MKNILVVFGGCSCEKEVSVITGVMTANNVNKNNYNVIPIYVAENGFWYTSSILFDISAYKTLNLNLLKRVTLLQGDNRIFYITKNKLKQGEHISCIINCLHGVSGEDGSLSALALLSNIPIASPNLSSSAISMDKYLTKLFLKALNIKTLPYVYLTNKSKINSKIIKNLNYPLIVKPCKQGSSIGISSANNYSELLHAINVAFRYDNVVLIEQKLQSFRELNCAVYKYGNKIITSKLEEPISNGFLSFDDKYNNGTREFPANVNQKITKKVQQTAQKIYDKLNFSGVIRIDFLYYNNQIFVNEINGVPGSLSYYLFCDTFSEFSGILEKIIIDAEQNFNANSTLKNKYSSSVLLINGAKGGKSR